MEVLSAKCSPFRKRCSPDEIGEEQAESDIPFHLAQIVDAFALMQTEQTATVDEKKVKQTARTNFFSTIIWRF